MYDRKAVAFTGPSNSGKTTLIEKIARTLVNDRKVVIVKNDPSDKAVFDTKGKDSDKFFKTGADVIVVSPVRTTMMSHSGSSMEEISRLFGDFDLMLVEGLKNLPLPRIGIFRGAIDKDYLDVIDAVAIDDTVDINKYEIPDEITLLNLNDTDSIIDWIDRNATVM